MILKNTDVESNDFDLLPRLFDLCFLFVFGEETLDLVEFIVTKVKRMLIRAVVRG